MRLSEGIKISGVSKEQKKEIYGYFDEHEDEIMNALHKGIVRKILFDEPTDNIINDLKKELKRLDKK